jgi:Pyruvate/2-oxoglutarate dehydrogenase complex, dihydrolipoamide acyltransferase (E2) component, and related enzymes
MAEVVNMPRLSDTMEEGTVAKWHKQVGDKVEEGDLLAEIETDKATMDYESFQEGTLLHIGVQEGETAPVDSLLAILGEEGQDYQDLLSEGKEASSKSKESEEQSEDQEEEPRTAASGPEVPQGNEGRIKASPLARKLAQEKGVDLNQLRGSGEGGRIVKRDVDEYAPQATPAQAAPAQSAPVAEPPSDLTYEEVNVSQMRKTIARRLGESKFSAPHFYLTLDIDMDGAIAARKQLNTLAEEKIS